MRIVAMALLLVGCGPEKLDPEDGLEREELGTLTTDAEGGVDVTFDPAANAVSALVHCGPYGYETFATAESITGPDGSVLYDMGDPTGTPMRVGRESDLLPVLLPVSPDLDFTVGEHTLRVAFEAEEAVSVTCAAVYRTQPVEANPKVDLRLVFVGVNDIAPGLSAAEGETTLAAVLEEVETLWGGGNLSVGTVTYSDFEGDVDAYTVVDGAEELGGLLRTVDAGGDRSVTVFFVQELTDDEGAPLLGYASAPGAAAVGASSKSGVVVTAASFVSDPSEVARTLAHETGHFLGLFHTTEMDGSQSDPLSDTPECASDPDGNDIFAPNECEGTGAENLMFWSAQDGSTLSADQGWVVSRSSAVR